ncbi:MAG: hypothetical protein LCH39_01880 [Proteobacteria bacterium]|nr:hypothetical protein [Pseudomonadota bacterium]
MFGRFLDLAPVRLALNSLSFNRLFGKSMVPGRKAVPRGRPGVPAKIDHFNWRRHSTRGGGRPALTYRGARRNAMKRRAA